MRNEQTLPDRPWRELKNVKVLVSEELTVKLAQSIGATVLVRGVRGGSDLDSEMSIAGLNEKLDNHIQTILFQPLPITVIFHPAWLKKLPNSMVVLINLFQNRW